MSGSGIFKYVPEYSGRLGGQSYLGSLSNPCLCFLLEFLKLFWKLLGVSICRPGCQSYFNVCFSNLLNCSRMFSEKVNICWEVRATLESYLI
jgi:hypothetical protein